MRGLVFVLFVICLTSLSNSELILELSVDDVTDGPNNTTDILLAPSDTFTLGVYCTADPTYTSYWIGIDGPGSISGSGTVYSPPSPDITVYDYYGDGTWYFFNVNPVVVPDLDTGLWWDVEFHLDAIWNNLHDSQDFHDYYDLVFSRENIEIYKLRK